MPSITPTPCAGYTTFSPTLNITVIDFGLQKLRVSLPILAESLLFRQRETVSRRPADASRTITHALPNDHTKLLMPLRIPRRFGPETGCGGRLARRACDVGANRHPRERHA